MTEGIPFRGVSLGPTNALPDSAMYDAFLSIQKLNAAATITDTTANTALGKLQIHMATLARRESLWLLAAFELMYDRPELAIMLGGTGLAQVNALANMLKQEGDRAYAKEMFSQSAGKVIRALGPLGLGKDTKISTSGSGYLYNNTKKSSVYNTISRWWYGEAATDGLKQNKDYLNKWPEDTWG